MLDEVKSLFGRFGRRDPAPVLTERVRIVNPFHAVSIAADPHACDAAKARAGQRYLSREAPRLPLADCGSPDCRCRYLHHDDRRAYARRMADGREAAPAPPYVGLERRFRSSGGRRSRD